MKEIKCPYCNLYNNTISNNTLSILSDSDFFSLECNKCGKTIGVELHREKYRSFKIPCKNKESHLFKEIGKNKKQCEYCKEIIIIEK